MYGEIILSGRTFSYWPDAALSATTNGWTSMGLIVDFLPAALIA